MIRHLPFIALLVAIPSSSLASSLGPLEDFSGGTPAWGVGQQYGIGAAVIQSDGGPDGAGDPYLLYTSAGSGRGGARMVVPADVFVDDSWAGDYAAAGYSALTADVQNPGSAPLALRLAISSTDASYSSITPILLPAGTEWTSVAFHFDAGAFTNLTGNAAEWPLSRVLTDVQDIRLLSSEGDPSLGNPYPRGDSIAAQIGLDNVALIPEPSSVAIVSLLSLAAYRRR